MQLNVTLQRSVRELSSIEKYKQEVAIWFSVSFFFILMLHWFSFYFSLSTTDQFRSAGLDAAAQKRSFLARERRPSMWTKNLICRPSLLTACLSVCVCECVCMYIYICVCVCVMRARAFSLSKMIASWLRRSKCLRRALCRKRACVFLLLSFRLCSLTNFFCVWSSTGDCLLRSWRICAHSPQGQADSRGIFLLLLRRRRWWSASHWNVVVDALTRPGNGRQSCVALVDERQERRCAKGSAFCWCVCYYIYI